MALFSICSLMVEADMLPHSYTPFLTNKRSTSKSIDLSLRHSNNSQLIKNLRKCADLTSMTIWKEEGVEYSIPHWLFKARDGMCTASVDFAYTEVQFSYHEALDFFGKAQVAELLAPYFQVMIECKLIQNSFSILHSACVEINGTAYAFTGPSGIGKSSRAKKWVELLSAEWISGDRPAIDVHNKMAYGVPWDGKESIYKNTSCPLAAILKVTRSQSTSIREMSDEEKLQLLFEQTFFPLWDTDLAAKAMASLKQLITQIPIFELCCDISDESTYEAYEMVTRAVNARKGAVNEKET